jgi:hypothetical protein
MHPVLKRVHRKIALACEGGSAAGETEYPGGAGARLAPRWISANGNEEAMKKIALVVLLLLPAFAWADPNPVDYTIDVHVSSSHLDVDQGGKITTVTQRLEVTIGGKKYELEATRNGAKLLALGDYKARLVQDQHKTSYESWQIYEFLFPDKKTGQYAVVGVKE